MNGLCHTQLKRASSQGFSLIELMATVVIISLLSAIAFPSYTNFVKKSRRSTAKSTLLQMYARQENHFANVKSYASKASQLGYKNDVVWLDDSGDEESGETSESIYSVEIDRTSNFEYSITASVAGRQVIDTDCVSFTITHQGTKSAKNDEGFASTDCW